MDLDLDGNAALVTASSSGLGVASAAALAREGVDVVVNGRDEDRLEAAVAEIESLATGEVIGVSGDITRRADVETLVERTVDEFGGLDHLVTSAGGPDPLGPLEATDEDWYHAFDLLVMSVVRTVRAAAPHLRADGGGSMVSIASVTVKEASPRNVLSSAVRMAVVGYAKTLAATLAPEVRVNTVLPGFIETPRLEDFDPALRDEVIEGVPLGRFGDPEEFGTTVAHLCSPRAGFVTGQAVGIEGGLGSSTL